MLRASHKSLRTTREGIALCSPHSFRNIARSVLSSNRISNVWDSKCDEVAFLHYSGSSESSLSVHTQRVLSSFTNSSSKIHGLLSPKICFRSLRNPLTLDTFRAASTVTNEDNNAISQEKSIEERYSRKTQLEHILLRPGMYVGPVEKQDASPQWVIYPLPPPPIDPSEYLNNTFDDKTSNNKNEDMNKVNPMMKSSKVAHMRKENISTHPALIKVFDEILVNALDNLHRYSSHPSSKNATTQINVIIDPGNEALQRPPFISITNDGKGIPVHMHKTEKMYVPELLFGNLLTGSNFDDDEKEKRVVGGRHGYGAKLANVFSDWFEIYIADSRRKKGYKQVWTDNMTKKHEPTIWDLDESEFRNGDKTRVSFCPDLQRLAVLDKQQHPSNGSKMSTANDQTSTMHQFRAIPQGDYALMCRRVYDIAGCAGDRILVTLNGHTIPISNFREYVGLYRRNLYNEPPSSSSKSMPLPLPPIKFHKINSRWEVGIGLSPSGRFESVSFVNGIATSRGGTHINALVNQIVPDMMQKIFKLYPDISKSSITAGLVKRNIIIFVNCLVENPSFDSQMKEFLSTQPADFGSNYEISNRFLKEVLKKEIIIQPNKDKKYNQQDLQERENGGPGILEEAVQMARGREQANLLRDLGGGKNSKNSRRQLLSIPKLDDAHLAGTNPIDSSKCTLILTEGDSAKALAVSGLEIVGRDTFGVFPLRGKFLNVRDASSSQLTKNAEVKAICTILGLDFNKTYSTMDERSTLRYGHVMLMTDSDADGSHIKGLVVNFFRHFWPDILRPVISDDLSNEPENQSLYQHSFLSSFITPLLKATRIKGEKGVGMKGETLSFFTASEYDTWRKSLSEKDEEKKEINKWNVKYYKGLGTSTQAEAKEYFRNYDKHQRSFYWQSENDGKMIDMLFEKERAKDRRRWLTESCGEPFDQEPIVETSLLNQDKELDGLGQPSMKLTPMSYEDFVNKEMIIYSNADNIRSIPNVIDGLKPSQRKVLYACFKRKLKNEIKVAQLTGYCAEHTAYHHGEASLQATITGMAQDFVGSNNINLLLPSGQFGTRIAGGKDAASPRYIFTSLSPIARLLFPEVDDALLTYLEDDGQIIEPPFYCPIIPLLLVNGAQGIGTGFSTYIPPHDPRDVVEYVKARLIDNDDRPLIKPWVKGFIGKIEIKEDGSGYRSLGKAKKKSRTSVEITELPVGKWTNDYKQLLIKMQKNGEIQSFLENHTTSSVSFTVFLKAIQLRRMMSTSLEKAFKLESSLPISNMHAFDADQNICKYDSPEDIANAHFSTRLPLYYERKNRLENIRKYNALLMSNKARFIEQVVDGNIDLVAQKKKGMTEVETSYLLEEMGFMKMTDLKNIKIENSKGSEFVNALKLPAIQELNHKEYDYLLNMPLSSLTSDRVDGLRRDAQKSEKELSFITNTVPEDLWREDLSKLERLI
mmetsp:Transcript_7392/g.10576  ORF Transcript_7392/g.10576 Transcript_7392/m.10576 type:complete len:1439 (+) Transcript_7392:256-4572(+)|eukprot:CAMPEP_0184871304 /NCGR_PEP_ID=MMETSP0580-20130426/40642_1 /TAXON_ID=1118495 /ORGANISM="Dactyliosolen fragilissimus" /LENGTH=1438 /DNA_ID=CAMNT_0027373947 /DNA_START=173 /DNA_END=4489 /DNA_ORIENTATION=+